MKLIDGDKGYGKNDYLWGTRTFSGMLEICPLFWVVVTGVYAYVKSHQAAYLRLR